MESLVLKPTTPKLDLIPDLTAISTFSRNVILISESGIFRSLPIR